MSRRRIRLFGMAMCIVMIVSLFGGIAMAEVTADEKAGDRDILASEQVGQGSVATEEDGPFGRYKEPITIEMIKYTNQFHIENMGKMFAANGWETMEDNRWTRLFKDELNIEVKYTWIADIDQADQKWKMVMASGDIPDVSPIKRENLVELSQLAEAGIIRDMGEIWEQYASPLTRSVTVADSELVYDAVNVGGKMMAVPEVMAALDSYKYLWIRTDWMEKLGLEAPTNMDEFMALMEAFVTQDPDGNGEDDTYAFLLDKQLWSGAGGLEGFFWGFNAYPDAWLKADDGSLVFGGIQPEMVEPLKKLQEMYNNGWLDKEFVVKDRNKALELLNANKIGVAAGSHAIPYEIGKVREIDPGADWGVFDWPSATGSPTIGEVELGLYFALAVRQDYEHPEAIVKMLNLFYEKLYGETGDYSYWGNDDEIGVDGTWFAGPMCAFHPLINILPYRDAVKVENGEMLESELKGASLNYWNNGQKYWEWQRMWMPGNHSAGDHIESVLSNKQLFTDNFAGAATPTMVDKWSQLKEMTDTTVTKIITGELDAETGFNNYVADWNRLGGDAITAEVNEWYQSLG